MPSGGSLLVDVDGVNWAAAAAAVRSLNKDLWRDLSLAIGRAARTHMVRPMRAEIQGVSTSSSGGGWVARAAYAASRSRGPLTAASIARHVGRSGLRDTVARTVTITKATGGAKAGVRIVARASKLPPDQRQLPRYMDRGQWRHPVFGNEKAWVTQTVSPPGWFTKTAREHAPQVRELVVEATSKAVREATARLDAAG